MDSIAVILLSTATIFTMTFKSIISAGLLALALTHLLQLSGSMQWAVRQTAEAENHMTAVERMLGYCGLEQERAATAADGGGRPPPGWPASAALEFRGVTARYRPGLEPVLRDLSFTVRTCWASRGTRRRQRQRGFQSFRMASQATGCHAACWSAMHALAAVGPGCCIAKCMGCWCSTMPSVKPPGSPDLMHHLGIFCITLGNGNRALTIRLA